jgi:hypothetical protein
LIGTPAKIDSSIAGTPAGVPGNLDEDVRPRRLGVQPGRDRRSSSGVVDEQRRDLERDPAVDAAAAVVDRPEQVGGVGQVVDREREEQLLARAPGARQLADLIVVGVAGTDRLLEDGRVRGQSGDRVLGDVARQRAVAEHVAADVVEPEGLAELVQLAGGGVHGFSLRAEQRVEIDSEQVADALDAAVGGWVASGVGRVVGVVALARKDGHEALAPDRLHRREDALLVVDHHVAARRKVVGDDVEHAFLVDEDQDPVVDRGAQPRALELARLEDDVAVGQDHGRAVTAELRDDVQCARVEPLCERIVDQKARHRQQPVRARAARLDVGAVALQRAEVVGIAELAAQALELDPVAVGARRTELAHQVLAQVGDDAVVVEQRVVDVEQEDDVVRRRLRRPRNRSPSPSALGSARLSRSGEPALPARGRASRRRRRSARRRPPGPQLPGAYGSAGAWSASTGSTTAQAASTAS